jgi:integrase
MTEPTVRQRRRRRPTLTDLQVAALPRRAVTYFHPDPELRKFGVRVRPAGAGTYTVICRNPYGKQKWVRIGTTAELDIAQARAKARKVIERIEQGLAPFEPPPPEPASVQAVVEAWLTRHVERHRLRSGRELRRIVERYILPHWAKRDFAAIRRRDVVELLDHIEDSAGPAMADGVLKVTRAIMRWHADERDETFTPIRFSSRMSRVPPQDRRRSRVLDDKELRAVWRAAEDGGAFGAMVQLLLLTAQRRTKIRQMRWADVDLESGTWSIPRAEREKGAPAQLVLPEAAINVVAAQPRFAGNPFVFHQGMNFARAKAAFDKACGVTGWRLHDLRRTARTLLSRAGVRPDVAERCLGHVASGVEGIYDKYSYGTEMAEALRRLAALVEAITNPPEGDNILHLPIAAVVSS